MPPKNKIETNVYFFQLNITLFRLILKQSKINNKNTRVSLKVIQMIERYSNVARRTKDNDNSNTILLYLLLFFFFIIIHLFLRQSEKILAWYSEKEEIYHNVICPETMIIEKTR